MDRRDWAALHCVALHCVVIMIPHPKYTIHIANPLVWSFRAISEEITSIDQSNELQKKQETMLSPRSSPKKPPTPQLPKSSLSHATHPSIHHSTQLNSTQLNSTQTQTQKCPSTALGTYNSSRCRSSSAVSSLPRHANASSMRATLLKPMMGLVLQVYRQ